MKCNHCKSGLRKMSSDRYNSFYSCMCGITRMFVYYGPRIYNKPVRRNV